MKTFFEKGCHDVGQGNVVEWVRVRNDDPRGLVLAAPLIGGAVSQQVQAFRWLIRKAFDFITFNYSGHGSSTDRFSLGASLRDVHDMLSKVLHMGSYEGLPLLGIASCYSAIPFLAAIDRLSEPMHRLVLINAVSRLSPWSITRSFLGYYRHVSSAVDRVVGIRLALRRYADRLFPGVVKNGHAFGVLQRRRARVGRTLSEFFTLNPLRDVRLTRTPTLCLYARHDPILEIYRSDSWSNYRRDIIRICPKTVFGVLDGDHFLSGIARRQATAFISLFFETG